jgi:capsular polysaccharide biosynthesis protein
MVTATSLSEQVLQIQVQAPGDGYAEQLANAVAASYIKYVGQLRENSSGVAALQQESSELTQQIQALQNQINTVSARITSEGAGSAAGQSDGALVSSLRNEQNQVALQLNGVTGQIVATQLSSGSPASTVRVLQTAAVLPVSHTGPLIEAGIIGLGIGLVGGVVYVLVRRQRDSRLRVRDEIARAAGAPVIASLEVPNCTTTSAWHALLESQSRAESAWALRRVLNVVLGSSPRKSVRVISFAGDSPALATGPQLALYAAGSGTPTALVPGDHKSVQSLRASFVGTEPIGGHLPLTVGLDNVANDRTELVVAIDICDGESTDFDASESLNLLSISPGVATAEDLSRLALMAADSGSPLDMVVVVNPDPGDRTSGFSIDDKLRLLPSHPSSEEGKSGLVHLGQRTSEARGSAELRISREY